MDFSISPADQTRLATLRHLGREHFRPAGLRADAMLAPLPVDDTFFATMLEHGYGRTTWHAGGGTAPPNRAPSAVAQVLISEEGSYWDRGIGVAMPGPGLGESPMLGMGTEEQKERFLTPFIAPTKPIWGAFSMTEPSGGSDVARIKTRAVRDGSHWVLNGAKAFCGNASRAEWIVVFATIDPAAGRAGHRAFVVERGTPGLGDFHIEKKMGLRSYESTSYYLTDCRVPADNLLGGEAYYDSRAGFKGAMATFNAGRPAIGAMGVGIGRAALDEATAFAQAHGLMKNVRVRDRIERCRRRLKSALLLALKAAWMADQRTPNMTEASMAKALGAAVAFDATSLGMEIVGMAAGRGDLLIEKLFRDVKAMDIVEGTGQIQRLVIARQLVGLPN